MIEKLSGLWNSIAKYMGCGSCIIALSIAYNIQYLLMIQYNHGDPLLEVYSSILLIEFILLSASVGVLNQQFSRRFWFLKREYGYPNMVVKGIILVGFTVLTLSTLSTPFYLLAQIPPPAIQFQHQLGYMVPIGLAMSPVMGILAKEVSFLELLAPSKKEEQSTLLE